MLIEYVEDFYRKEAEQRNLTPGNWARASSLGYCPRRLGYQKLGVQGEPLTPRRLSIFHHGDALDLAMKQDLMQALGGAVITDNHRGEVEIEGVKITGECDGLFYVNGRYGVVDGKTMSDFAFDRACNGIIDEPYQVQGWVYSQIYGVDLVLFYCYRKETSHVVEVIFDAQIDAIVVAKRFGGNEKEIYINDPLLIAEVRTPFSPEIEAKARATIKAVTACESIATLPEGVNAIESEVVKVQGAANADAFANANPGAKNTAKSGAWFTFETGRKILGFPCTYCPFYKHCFPQARMEVEGGKPKWILEAA